MAKSQNGWEVIESGSSAALVNSPWLTGKVRTGVVATVLNYVAEQFNKRVEPVIKIHSWGYANRNVKGSTDTSNHASGTAEDLNAPAHPLGAVNTFSPTQRAEIQKILSEVGGVVRWGGNYSGRKDEMHFEINASFDEVFRVAARLEGRSNEDETVPESEEEMMLLIRNTTSGAVVLLSGGKAFPVIGIKNYAAFQTAVPAVGVSAEQFDSVVKTAAK